MFILDCNYLIDDNLYGDEYKLYSFDRTSNFIFYMLYVIILFITVESYQHNFFVVL